jgi:hypothetical protein
MAVRRVGGWVAAVSIAALLAGSGLLGERSVRAADDADAPAFSADDLGDMKDDNSILDMLEPEEREALTRSQMTGLPEDAPKPVAPEKEGFGDKLGKLSLSIASVAVAVGAVVAPFFLF